MECLAVQVKKFLNQTANPATTQPARCWSALSSGWCSRIEHQTAGSSQKSASVKSSSLDCTSCRDFSYSASSHTIAKISGTSSGVDGRMRKLLTESNSQVETLRGASDVDVAAYGIHLQLDWRGVGV